MLAIVTLGATSAGADEARPPGPGWEEASRTDELAIFARAPGEDGVRELVAVGMVDATPAALFRLLAAYEAYPSFMPYTEETRIVRRASEARFTVYQRISPPLVDDRDWAIDVTLAPASVPGGASRISWSSRPDAVPVREGCVRVRVNAGSWLLEPLAGGTRTRLTHRLRTHPGGSLPALVVERSNTVALPELFAAIRRRAAAPATRP